jgi:hypothetical protein
MKKCFYISEIGSSGLTKELSSWKDRISNIEERAELLDIMFERYDVAQNGVSLFIRRGNSNIRVNRQRVRLEKQSVFLIHCKKLEAINRDLTKEEYNDFCDAVDIYCRDFIPNFEIISITT